MNTIQINIHQSLLKGGGFIKSSPGSNYTHTLNVLGGCESASFTEGTTLTGAEDWIEDGLLRHIVVYDDAQNKIFEGFVNKISVNMGPLTIDRGPIVNLANRVAVVYSTVDTTTMPPTVGNRTKTSVSDGTTSQGKYGIWTVNLSSGGATTTDAEQIRDTYLTENQYPETSQKINLMQSNTITVSIEVLGYYHLFKYYPYNQTASTGTGNLSVKMAAVIAANPNIAWTPFTTGGITTNILQVPLYENDDNTAWDVIKGLVALGDANDTRYTFGVYPGLAVKYQAVTNNIDYMARITGQELQITNTSQQPVRPWNIIPGRWLFFPDLMAGRAIPTDRRLDPRFLFIEEVTYTAPYGLQLTGGKTEKLPQKLAKFGLAGVGA